MNIDFIMDPICPWCYIGRSRLKRALKAWKHDDVHVNFIPFQLNPDMAREGMDRDTYMHLKFGSVRSARAVMDGISRAAMAEGLEISQDTISRTPNTLDAHRMISWAAASNDTARVVDALFHAYLVDGRDIGNRDVLLEIAAENALDKGSLSHWLYGDTGVEQIKSTEELARQMGVRGVPFFIIDGRFAITGAEDMSVFAQVFDLATNTGFTTGSMGLGPDLSLSSGY